MNLFDQILEDTYTQTDALRRLRLIKYLATAKLFGSSKEKEEETLAEDSAWLSTQDKTLALLTRENVYQETETASDKILSIKPLIVYLPFELLYQEVQKLGQHLRTTYGKNFLVEVKIDPNLIAGCALVWKGVYKDYSLRQKIQEQKEKILQVFRSYAKK